MNSDLSEAERWAALKDRSRIFPSSHPFRRLFLEHPGLILTASYFFLTAIGFTYTSLLFLNFRINIIYYAEISDFLTEPGIQIKTPAILLGTTSRFVFLHEPEHRITHIIPNERIAELIVQGKKKKGALDASQPAKKP